MAIRRYDEKNPSEIKAGQWINGPTMLTLLMCSRPLLVTSDVTKDRVYYRRPGWDADEPDKYIRRSSVVFVCDTRDEAEAMHQMAEQRMAEIQAAIKAVEDKFEVLIVERVQASGGGDAAA